MLIQWTRGQEESRPYLEQSLALYEALGDENGIATLLFRLAENSHRQGDRDTAQRLLEQSLALSRKRGEPFAIATALGALGNLAWKQQAFETARQRYAECLDLQRQVGNKIGVSDSLMSLANLARVAGDYEGAVSLLTESTAICRDVGNVIGLGWTLLGLGNVMCLLGHAARASALYTESLDAWQAEEGEGFVLGAGDDVAFILERMAALAASCPPGPVGAGRGARLLGAAQALRESVGWPLPLVDHADYYDVLISDLRVVLGDEGFASAWADGEAMTQEHVIAFARHAMREIAP